MLDRTKYAEYLDSATIYNFINGLEERLSRKIFLAKFRKPFLASGERFFDSVYSKEGVFILRNEEGEIIRSGFSCKDARSQMYHYLSRTPKEITNNCDCAIINTSNGEHKKLALLFERVVRFEADYHNYLLLKDYIEKEEGKVPILFLEKLPPYTGVKNKYGREWTIPKQDWKSGVYIIFKDGVVDYVGKGKRLAKRLYSHFEDRSHHKRYTANGEEYGYQHAYYSKEEEVNVLISTIPFYRKVIQKKALFSEEIILEEESDFEFDYRMLELESRLIQQYSPRRNRSGKIEEPEETKTEAIENASVIVEELSEDPPF